MEIYAWIYIFAFLSLHEMQDGHVEASLEVIVRKDIAEVTYSVAINDQTMRDQLDSALGDSAHSQPGKLLDQYRTQMLSEIGKNINFTIDDQQISLDPVGSEIGNRHPIRFICKYSARLPRTALETANIRIEDRNYRQLQKSFRAALRTKPKELLVESNVPSLLVRTNHVVLSDLDQNQQLEAQTMNAIIQSGIERAKNPTTKDGVEKVEANQSPPDSLANPTLNPTAQRWTIFLIGLSVVVAIELIYFAIRNRHSQSTP